MDKPTMAQMLQGGMRGTQGGPVQESPTMSAERILQMVPNIAAQGTLGYGLATGNPFAMMTGGGGMLATEGMMNNAAEPNIRDVWADKLRMQMQGN
jgi:hypothetical protein